MKIHINIRGINGMEITPALREYIEKKIAAVEEKFLEHPENADAMVEVGRMSAHHHAGEIFRAETILTLHNGGGKIIAAAEKDDLYAAIDEMKDIVEQEILHRKNKMRTLWRRGQALMKKFLRK